MFYIDKFYKEKRGSKTKQWIVCDLLLGKQTAIGTTEANLCKNKI